MTSCFWIFGRGASCANGLTWSVPPDWNESLINESVSREQLIEKIRSSIIREMDTIDVLCEPYNTFLHLLNDRTPEDVNHHFLTTNWDFLLQRHPLLNCNYIRPYWPFDKVVYHLNGTVEEGTFNRSPFLLETDPVEERAWSVEANIAYNKLLWCKYIIIVGMSFACSTDQSFLAALSTTKNHLPIGEAEVLIINPDPVQLEAVKVKMEQALPHTQIKTVAKKFDEWVKNDNMSELADDGLLEIR